MSLLQREFMTEEPGDSQALERARVKIGDTCAADLIRLSEMRQGAAPAIRTTARFVWRIRCSSGTCTRLAITTPCPNLLMRA